MIRKPMDVDTCPDAKELQAYRARILIGKRNEAVFLHLKLCAHCLRKLADLSRLPSPEEIIYRGKLPWWKRFFTRKRRE